METKLYRMNTEIESSSTNRTGSPADGQSTVRSTNVQSQASKLTSSDTPPDLLLDSPPVTCSSFSTTTSSSNHQTSLPCSTNCGADQSRENGEFATADLEFDGDYSNLLAATELPSQTTQATTSLSPNNLLLDKVDNNSIHSAARSSPPPAARSPDAPSGADRMTTDSLIESLNRQLATPPSSASPKLDSNSLSADKLSRAEAVDDDCLTEKLTEQLKEKLAEHLNQQLISQQLEQEFGQQMNQQISQQISQQIGRQLKEPNDPVASSSCEQSEEETGSEECSSEEEVARTAGATPANSKKRSRSGLQSHLCSKKRRKQSNPVRCDFEPTEKAALNEANSKLNPFNQLSQHLNQQLKQLLTDQLNSQLNSQLAGIEQQQPNSNKKKQPDERLNRGPPDEDDQEEGLVCKFPNAVSSAASATARFFLANHQVGSQSSKSDAGESQINYTYYLAAAAAVATRASLKGTKHCLNYCKECCCPFLSAEHEKQYRQLEKQAGREAGKESGPVASQQPPNNPERSVFAQQLESLAQRSKLMQEMESVFGSSFEAGQLPQQNAIDAMQLIKQLESGQLDNEEAKVHQQQLASLLLNTNMLSVSNSNQAANPLSALLAGRIFNPDAYCSICKKEFCNKYFLKTHMANKHGIQDQQSSAAQDKCISPTNNVVEKYFAKGQPKQKAQQNETTECANQKSPISVSPKQQETANQQQLQYELMNAITTEPSNEDAIGHSISEQQQKEMIRNQNLALQVLSNASQLQQISAVMQAEQFANILRNSIVQPPNTNNPSDLSSTDLAKLLNSNNSNFFFTPERLREMGVTNPEAFCEICLKEFCNKYFLKTHKANKHGIQMDEDELGANSSNSCDSKSNHHNDQNTDKSNKEMCNLNDDESLEPGQCQSSINPMDLTTLIMINNFKQHQSNLLGQGQPQLANPQLNQQLSINQAPRNSKESPLSLNTSINKVEQESMDFRVASKAGKLVSDRYAHKLFVKDDQADKIEQQQQNTIDRNNNSNNEENVPKEMNSELTGLDLSQQQSILGQEQKEDILKFQQIIKELQSNSEIDLEQAIFKKIAMMQRPPQMPAKLNEEINQSTYCDVCEKDFRSRTALRNHNCPGNENNRLSDSPSNSMFSNISAQMANTLLNNSNNSTLNYAINGDTESLVNQKGKANKQLSISSNGRDSLINNLNMSIACSNQPTANRLSPGQNNPIFNSLPPNTPYDVAQSIFGSDKSGITLDPNNKQPKFVAGRNYCNLCAKELCNKYFMKTHMMKMHNINIDEHPAEAAANSIVGGVMCDLCKKELCSKYFLKVHKQNTHGIYEDNCIPVTNQQQGSGSSGLMTTSSTVQSSLPSALVSTQSNLSPNTCVSSANGLMNQSTAGGLNPLLSNAYEAGLSKEQIQQLQMELSKHQNLLGPKNGNSMQQAAFLEQSNTPISFGTSAGSANSVLQATPPLNGTPIGNDKELFHLQGIDPGDITNRYFNQWSEICPLCKRRFKSIKWMKTHIANEHPNLLGNSPSSNSSKSNLSAKQPPNEPTSDKMRCIFCTRLFSDSGLLHYHLVHDHRNSLEEMIIATGMDLSNNFGAASEDAFGRAKTNEQNEPEKSFTLKPNKLEDQFNLLQSASGELIKNEALLNELLNKNKRQSPKKPTAEQAKLASKADELADSKEKSKLDQDTEHQQSEQSDIEEQTNLADEKQSNSHNLTNILQLMRKHQNGGTTAELSGDEEQLDEEDEESISEEERFAAMLNNNAQLQQLLLSSSTAAATQQQQPSTSATNNSKALSIYEELLAQQPAANHHADLSPSNEDNPPDSELSDYERFSRAVQQHQLLQQLKQDQLSTRLVQQQQQQQQQNNNRAKPQPSRGSNSVYTKLYQCNICEYNTRWLSNLYAHEKRRHNTCSSSSGNLKVITIRRDIPSPNAPLTANRANAQLSLNSLLNGLEGGKLSSAISGQQTGHLDTADLMSKFNDFNNNPSVGFGLLQPNDSNRPTRPIKERTASGDGQFVCHICNRSYRHKHSLQRHLVCHRNAENNNSSLPAIKTNPDQLANFKQSEQSHSPNDLLNCSASSLPFAQPPSNGTSTPSLFNNNSTGRSSVDSVNSGEHSLKQAGSQASNHQLASQMFAGLNQEMLESFLISSGSNSTLLGNLIAGSSSTVHSPNSASIAAAYSSSASDNGSVATGAAATASNSAAMFSV